MYDVVIIGAGVVGCAVARELSRWQLKVAVCERKSDVADAASKANSAIVHSGHSTDPGSLMAKFNLEGNLLFEKLCEELQVPFVKNGSLNIAFDEDDAAKLEQLLKDGIANGVPDMEIIGQEKLREMEPQLSKEIIAALYAPSCAMTSPYELTAALAENAAINNIEFFLNCEVLQVEKRDDNWAIFCSDRLLKSKIVLNAAGVYSDYFNNQVSQEKIKILPRKGQYWIVDKSYEGSFHSTIFQVPGKSGKGILVTPTVDGTILLGPTAEDQEDPEDTETTAKGLEEILTTAKKIWPALPTRGLIGSFAGVRAHTANKEFIIGEVKDAPGFFNAAGIESPGLTAAPAIGKFLAEQICEKLKPEKNREFKAGRAVAKNFRDMTYAEKQKAIDENPAFGHIVCRCEQVTEAEIRASIRRPMGARTVDAVKRRTRAGMGRCQGGFCLPKVVDLLSQELGESPANITKEGSASPILLSGRADKIVNGASSVTAVSSGVDTSPALLIIGGGPAGLAAAIAAYDDGCRDILILEREAELGGILCQCIHTGFGVQYFSEELSGPEYAQRFIDLLETRSIRIQCDTMVLELSPEKEVTSVSPVYGLQKFTPQAVILAMGCRERPRGALGIPGSRAAGIFSAGTAQRFVNLEGFVPGKKVVILGSGDIGLIMARRMIFSGAQVAAVVEIMPFSSGLKRNVVQCLDDFDIPLLLNHTVTKIKGRGRINGVTISEVDKNLRPIPGTEKELECDTLLLSVGLIPENELSRSAAIELSMTTAGPEVDENLQTNVPGIFACGNVLHVHDLVDHVSEESARAGRSAAAYIRGEAPVAAQLIRIEEGFGARAVVPQFLSSEAMKKPVTITFRPTNVFENAYVLLEQNGKVIKKIKRRILIPGEMAVINLKAEDFKDADPQEKFVLKVLSK